METNKPQATRNEFSTLELRPRIPRYAFPFIRIGFPPSAWKAFDADLEERFQDTILSKGKFRAHIWLVYEIAVVVVLSPKNTGLLAAIGWIRNVSKQSGK